jgi:hypothetical protein
MLIFATLDIGRGVTGGLDTVCGDECVHTFFGVLVPGLPEDSFS